MAEATNKPDEAKAWKEERAKLPVDATRNPGGHEVTSEPPPEGGFFPVVYDELKRLVARLAGEANGHSLDANLIR